MSTFCQRLYHRKCQHRGVGGQEKPKSCQRSVWMTPYLYEVSCFSDCEILTVEWRLRNSDFLTTEKVKSCHQNSPRIFLTEKSSCFLIAKFWLWNYDLGILIVWQQKKLLVVIRIPQELSWRKKTDVSRIFQ